MCVLFVEVTHGGRYDVGCSSGEEAVPQADSARLNGCISFLMEGGLTDCDLGGLGP